MKCECKWCEFFVSQRQWKILFDHSQQYHPPRHYKEQHAFTRKPKAPEAT